MPDPEKIIDGLRKVERLKTVERQTLIGSRHESTSEHSFHAALIADMLAEVYPAGVDAQRVKDLVLYHDLVEVHAGDVALNDSDARETKEAAEHDAFKQLLTEIPNGERYKELYEEYEARETTEAVIAKKIDRLEVLVSAANEPRIVKEEGYTEEFLREQYEQIGMPVGPIDELHEQVLALLKEQGKI